MTAATIETVELPSGLRVLAKRAQGYLSAQTYANDTQANRRVEALTHAGVACRVTCGSYGRVRYIVVEEREP